jgi:hypothetical protein
MMMVSTLGKRKNQTSNAKKISRQVRRPKDAQLRVFSSGKRIRRPADGGRGKA